MNPVGWGITGFGWVARDFMAAAIADAGHRLVAVCDPRPAARRDAERLGVRTYADVEDLASDPEVEAVYVATPNHLHRPMVEVLSKRGKAVLCEKPMAHCLADAEAMVAACRTGGVLYGTAFDQRHHPVHAAARRQIVDGSIGCVTAIRIVYACWLGPEWTTGTGENWRTDAARAGGGSVIDLAPHGIDLVDFLLGEPLVDLSALLQRRVHDYAVDDGGVLIGRSASGALATLHVAYNCPEALPRRRLEIVGTLGLLTAQNSMGQEPGGQMWITDGRTGRTSELTVDGIDGSPFTLEIDAFSSAFRGAPHGFDAERDLASMRLLSDALARAMPEMASPNAGQGLTGLSGVR